MKVAITHISISWFPLYLRSYVLFSVLTWFQVDDGRVAQCGVRAVRIKLVA